MSVPALKGKLILHHFSCIGFNTGSVNYGADKEENLAIPTEFVVFELTCEHCGKTTTTGIQFSDIDYFLDRLTPAVTHDPNLRELILWYWDDNETSEAPRARRNKANRVP